VDEHYRTLVSPKHRALQGHSSGGFGAIVGTMMRPDVFGAFASHAGDVLYEHCYLPEIATAYRALRDRYGRSYANFFDELSQRKALTRQDDFSLAMVYAVAACFSAEPDGSVSLPFDPMSGRILPDVWERWLAWDPIRMVSRYVDALKSLCAIWIDAGKSDEYSFDIGAEILVEELRRVGVKDVAFELFEGGHGGVEHRYELGLRYLAERISPH
jgi:S-formylglutathione hydrolase FrmB